MHNYLQNITQHKKTGINKISVKFGLEKNNNVQKYAKEVMQGHLKPDYILNSKDVQDIIELIKKFVPNFEIVYKEVGEDPDKRNYVVSNEKLEKTGFKCNYSIEDGIKELVKGYNILLKNNPYANY